jgi:hypothetical protein
MFFSKTVNKKAPLKTRLLTPPPFSFGNAFSACGEAIKKTESVS